MPRFVNKTATIPAGQALSNAVDCSTGMPVFVYLPATWMPATLSFQVSPDGTNFSDLFTAESREIMLNVAAGTAVRLDQAWEPVTYLKVRSGSRHNVVPQDSNQLITIVLDTAASMAVTSSK